ncbi:hypothetical protein CMI37_03120 [Candidatus Pacearchaeota archaeon]|nr:hypothetical protein [Candidatus Pacearchaeota archaeon]|tara:strand:- start:349 stop:648 length:300 start_codon:yes stop_codon:yes gene_type:complete
MQVSFDSESLKQQLQAQAQQMQSQIHALFTYRDSTEAELTKTRAQLSSLIARITQIDELVELEKQKPAETPEKTMVEEAVEEAVEKAGNGAEKAAVKKA